MPTLLDPQLNPQLPVNEKPNEHPEHPEPAEPEPGPERPEVEVPNEAAPDAPVCRICLMNAEEAPELGKLIRPCQCRGTVAHVHVQCLNQWRKSAALRRSFWQCDQCGYKYQLVRTRALGIAKSRFIVGCSTMTLFTFLVFGVSFLFSLFLPSAWIDGTPSTVAHLVDESVDNTYAAWGDSWYYYYSYSNIGSSMWKVAYQALNDIFDDALFPMQPAEQPTSYRYKAARRKQARAKQAQPKAKQPVDARDGEATGPFKNTVPVPRAASEKPTRLRRELSEDDDDDGEFAAPGKPGFLVRMLRRFLLGLSVVGAFSFLQFGWAATLPLQMVRRRAAGGRRGEDRDSYGIVILVMILIGLAKAMYSTYQLTQTLSTELLRRAETAILEVGTNEIIPLDEPTNPFRFTRERLRSMGTRAFWRDLWWTVVRFIRGTKDTVVEAWNTIRREVGWREFLEGLRALAGAFLGLGGGIWVWQF